VVEFKPVVPGKFFLVDHALSRVEKGLKGTIEVSGKERADFFHPNQPVDSALAASIRPLIVAVCGLRWISTEQ